MSSANSENVNPNVCSRSVFIFEELANNELQDVRNHLLSQQWRQLDKEIKDDMTCRSRAESWVLAFLPRIFRDLKVMQQWQKLRKLTRFVMSLKIFCLLYPSSERKNKLEILSV